jgi:hypothetical protein
MTFPFVTQSPSPPQFNLDRRRWLNASLSSAVLSSATLSTGCSWKVERTFEYLQDVKLNDGKIITLRFKRVVLANGKDTDKFERILKVEMWYDALGIYFLDEPKDINGADLLMSFDIVNGVPMLVQIAQYADMVRHQGTKDCRLNYFKWVANKWLEVPEAEFPLDIVRYNLRGPNYFRSEADSLQKYGILDFPGARGEERISMLQYAKGVGLCSGRLPPKQNQIENQGRTK